MTSAVPHRRRLPNRRPSETRALTVGNHAFAATVGFDLVCCTKIYYISDPDP